MILVIDETNRHLHLEALEEAYRFRHKIFVEEAGWEDIRRADGLERDAFDDEHAVHMLLYEDGEIIGYQRMLPTIRPYLLNTIYPHLCDGEAPSGANIFEWTRFAVDPRFRGEGGSLGAAGAQLVLAYVEWGLSRGVDQVVVELAPIQMLKFLQCHFLVYPLGLIQRIGGKDTIAVIARFDERTRAQMHAVVAVSAEARRVA